MALEMSWNIKHWQKSLNFVISHGILTILNRNLTKFVPSLLTLRKLASVQTALVFFAFPQNVENARFEQRDGHTKLRNSHGKVIDKYFAKSLFA